MISYDDFKKIDLRAATIKAAEQVEGSEKLVKLEIDLGDDPPSREATEDSNLVPAQKRRQIRQIIAGIGKNYETEQLVGKQIIVVANLEPRVLMGLESQGMLLAADSPDGPVLLCLDKPVLPGASVK